MSRTYRKSYNRVEAFATELSDRRAKTKAKRRVQQHEDKSARDELAQYSHATRQLHQLHLRINDDAQSKL